MHYDLNHIFVLVKQTFTSGYYTYSFYFHSGATSSGVVRVSVDNYGFVFPNPAAQATLSTSTDVFISLPINFIYSTANPITSNDLTWLADYQSFNNFYNETQSDAKYPQIQMMSSSAGGFYLVCEPPALAPQDSQSMQSYYMVNIKLLYNRVL